MSLWSKFCLSCGPVVSDYASRGNPTMMKVKGKKQEKSKKKKMKIMKKMRDDDNTSVKPDGGDEMVNTQSGATGETKPEISH